MIPLVLTASEILAYHAGALTEIRRPVEPQPDPAVVRADVVGPWCHFEDEAGPPNERGNREGRMWTERCPLGAPDDVLYGQEGWALEDCGADGERVIWAADRGAAWVESTEVLGSIHYLDSDYEPPAWQPAETMPEWASRVRLVNRGVRVERADVWTWVVVVEVQK